MSSRPELYVKSLKEPILLSKEEAEMISRIHSDASKDNQFKIVIEGVWSGSKGEIKFVKFPPKEPERADYKKVEPMSYKDAIAFEKKILPHKIEAEVSGFGTYTWELFYAQKQGAIRIELQQRGGKESLVQVVTNPTIYPKVQEEIESFYLFKSRQAYAQKKELEA